MLPVTALVKKQNEPICKMPKDKKYWKQRFGTRVAEEMTPYHHHLDLRRIDDLDDEGLACLLTNVKGVNMLSVSLLKLLMMKPRWRKRIMILFDHLSLMSWREAKCIGVLQEKKCDFQFALKG